MKLNTSITAGIVGLALSAVNVQAFADDSRAFLGAGANDGLSFTVTCAPNVQGSTANYVFQIQGITANLPYIARMTVSKGGVTKFVEDPTNGNGGYGPLQVLAGGDGPYQVTISKVPRPGFTSTAGKMTIAVEHHCLAANGGHTGLESTRPEPIQMPPPPPPPPPPPVIQHAPGFSGALNRLTTEKKYRVECLPKNGQATARYKFRVKAATKTRSYGVKLTVTKDGNVLDVIDANNKDTAFTDWVDLEKGDGAYTLTVSKFSEDPSVDLNQGSMTFAVKHSCVDDQFKQTRLKGPKKLP